MAEYRDALPEIAALGAGVIGLSVDEPERSAALRRSLALPYPLLSDSGRRVVADWALYNRDEMGGIAYPAVFVIDRDRTVRYRSLDRMRSRVSAADVIAFLRGGADAKAPSEPRRAPVRPRLGTFLLAITNMLRYGMRSPHS